MKFAPIAKRILLFLLVNILVMVTITVVLGLFGVNRYLPYNNGLGALAAFCLLYGMAGAFISLGMSRLMAKWFMGVQVIPPDTHDPELRELVETVHGLARQAELPKMPEVGIYESEDVNAFATGPTRSRALVAVSTGLLRRMGAKEATAVLGHEITHVANGDMVTMTLLQGVINAFVMFLARILAFVVGQALRGRSSDDREERGGGFLELMLVIVFQLILSAFGMMVLCAFSRWREFRADAGGARLAGRENMIGALQALQRLYDPAVAEAEARQAQSFQSLKISDQHRGFLALFATHPPLEERIARLEKGQF
jgi:heat shock protein HtpX